MGIHISNIHLKVYNRKTKKAELMRLNRMEQKKVIHDLRAILFKMNLVARFDVR